MMGAVYTAEGGNVRVSAALVEGKLPGQVTVDLLGPDDLAIEEFGRGLAEALVMQNGLDALHQRLLERGDVAIEFPPEPLKGGPTRHMMCHVPGGIRVEFITPAQA